MDNPSKRKLNAPAAPETTNQDTSNTPDKRRKVIGPALPPPAASNSNSDDSDNSDSDDDDFGPRPPPPEGSLPPQAQSSAQSTTQPLNIAKEQEAKSAPKRDAWMLAPPTAGSDHSRVDPTKLRSRKFQSGPRIGNVPSGGGGVDSTWTETPEEKMRRLQDEAMGIFTSSSGPGGASGAGTGADDKAAQAMREKVQRYNERLGKEKTSSLADEKRRKEKEKGKEEEDDDPSKRAFDREKDMALSSKLTHAQRREMMSKAADFGSRFSKGKFL